VKGLSRLLQAWGRIQNEKAENGSFKSRNLESRKQKAGERQGDGRWERGEGTAGKWVLVLAGPDEGGYRKELERLVGELGCGGSVVFTGELDDAQKWEALAAADLFVMPSDFENFGNAIVEAMMAGLPVITTTGTPWKELPVAGAGWWVEPTVDAMTVALREALALPEETRREMGRQALTYSARFRPEQAASDLIQVYQWLLGRGAKPECVAV
jgi:glycosyltransferase involved in cell wall biosynthesis